MYGRTVRPVTPTSEVRTVMMWPVATIDGSATLSEVAEGLGADEIGALCVTEHGRLAGIVTERDLVTHLAAGADLDHLLAADVMSTDLVSICPEDSVLEAALQMEEAQVRHLPVLDGDLIAGIVSMRDLFTVLVDDAHDPTVVSVPSGARIQVVGR
jgi:CBS domain-containing protein